MKQLLYEADDYKSYLRARLDGPAGLGKGGRTRLCAAMGCQTAYLSQVLNGAAHLSLEQGDAVNRYLRLSDEDSEFFLLLIQQSRAGTRAFADYTRKKIERLRARRRMLKERLSLPQAMTLEQQTRYYGAWYYAAVHIATTVPRLQTTEALARQLGLKAELVARVLSFLLGAGLVAERDGAFAATSLAMHLGDDADLVARYHALWRVRCLAALETPGASDLHYSAVVTLSAADAAKVRELLVQCVEATAATVKTSPAEQLHCVTLDWFAL